jgi:predicted nucleic acid-binding protein
VALIVLDASVVIGLLERRDAHHLAAVAALRPHTMDTLSLPASAYAEVLTGPARAGRLESVREDLSALGARVDPLDEQVAENAARLRGRFRSLRLADALVIAHGETISADQILTTDRGWGRISRRVHVIG